jgi:hypothetical protein
VIALLLAACTGKADEKPGDTPGDTEPTVVEEEVLVSGRVTGALAARDNVVVAALDASNWRFGDAVDASELVSWSPGDGAFTIRLEPMTLPDVYAKAFVAAWEDLDGDGRFDVGAEALCDEAGEGWDGAYLYHRSDGSWAVGVEQAYVGAVAEHYSPVLDGDRCWR